MTFHKDPKTGRFMKKATRRRNVEIGVTENNHVAVGVNENDVVEVNESNEVGVNENNGLGVQGRRIVEISTLARNLSTCAGKNCELIQDLRNIIAESRNGFASIFSIRCSCGYVNKVKTGETHKSPRGRPIFNVNTIAAGAMIHAGMSYAAMERFASTLDIHPPSRTATKRREREIGPVMEKVARASCEGAVALEEALGEKDESSGKI